MKLSVIIPTYNAEKTIKKCVESIPKHEDLEIIVVNDASTDNTKDIIKELDCIRINLKTNKGVSYARNKGLKIARGEYILFLDSDDYIIPEVFEEAYKELYYIDMLFYDMEDNEGHIYEVNKRSIYNRVGCFKFIRKEFIGKTKYKVGISHMEDAYFHEELLAKNPTFKFMNKVMYHYNFPRQGSLTWIHQHTK